MLVRNPRLWLPKSLNSLRRAAAGLDLRGECVWPGVRNDLFVAHSSIYDFFARYTTGNRALDAGCGTGYGSMRLVAAGAQAVLGIDRDRRSIRYAAAHFKHSKLSFRAADCEALELPQASYDLIVASNVLEHLRSPERFLEAAAAGLAPSGTLLVVVPPITNSFLHSENEAIRFHVSNLTVDDWLNLFRALDWEVTIFRHMYAGGLHALDFSSPFRSKATEADFSFPVSDRDGLYTEPTLSAVYLLRRASRISSAD